MIVTVSVKGYFPPSFMFELYRERVFSSIDIVRKDEAGDSTLTTEPHPLSPQIVVCVEVAVKAEMSCVTTGALMEVTMSATGPAVTEDGYGNNSSQLVLSLMIAIERMFSYVLYGPVLT